MNSDTLPVSSFVLVDRPGKKTKKRKSLVHDKDKDGQVSTSYREALMFGLKFTSPTRSSLARQHSLVYARRMNGSGNWSLSDIEKDNEGFSFTVLSNSYDQNLTPGAFSNLTAQDVTVAAISPESDSSSGEVKEAVSMVLKGQSPKDALSHLEKSRAQSRQRVSKR